MFGSTVEQDLILEFTKEMFTMKQFEQVSLLVERVFPSAFGSVFSLFTS